MGPLELAIVVQDFQIFANGYERGAKMFREIRHQNASVRLEHVQNGASPFLT
jgi:hypothetical protein